MTVLLGTTAGALVAGGVYYGFSNLITTRTIQHRLDLKTISARLEGSDTIVPSPLSAASRVRRRPFANLFHSAWNENIETIFKTVGEWDTALLERGKKLLYETSVKRQ